MSTEVVLFLVFAVAVLVSTTLMIVAESPVNSAMSLVASFFFLAGIYVLLWAHTIAVLQVLVYAGAIMVLFLFVIMLLSLQETKLRWSSTASLGIGIVAAGALFVILVIALWRAQVPAGTFDTARQATFGTLERMGQVVFTQYLLPFEAVSLLLLVAIVGAVVVAKSRI